MTPSERRWLGSFLKGRQEDARRQLLQQQQHQIPDEHVRTEWLDYLNSFQESTHNVNLQEDFVKVPWQMERIMAFGFLILCGFLFAHHYHLTRYYSYLFDQNLDNNFRRYQVQHP